MVPVYFFSILCTFFAMVISVHHLVEAYNEKKRTEALMYGIFTIIFIALVIKLSYNIYVVLPEPY